LQTGLAALLEKFFDAVLVLIYSPGYLAISPDLVLASLQIKTVLIPLNHTNIIDSISFRAQSQSWQVVSDQLPANSIAKAAQIKAALELGYRKEKEAVEQEKIQSPEQAAQLILYEMSALDQEELWVILLNTRNHVQLIETIYRGSLNSSQVRVGELFKSAVRRNAASIIVAHNHPSGDPTPSPDDIAVTKAIVEAGKLLDVDVLDHLVIGSGKFVSLKQRGLGFSES